MKTVILAWGSLIWEPRSFQIATRFVPFGPVLPIEFSRVSGGNRLTLVIDEANGAPCRTYVAQSAHADLEKALLNLWVTSLLKYLLDRSALFNRACSSLAKVTKLFTAG